jgi:hypothetical protein
LALKPGTSAKASHSAGVYKIAVSTRISIALTVVTPYGITSSAFSNNYQITVARNNCDIILPPKSTTATTATASKSAHFAPRTTTPSANCYNAD